MDRAIFFYNPGPLGTNANKRSAENLKDKLASVFPEIRFVVIEVNDQPSHIQFF